MLFSQELWQRNLNLYQKILDLPFNQELANGTLDKEAFERTKKKHIGNFIKYFDSVTFIANNFITYKFKGINLLDYVEVMKKVTFEEVTEGNYSENPWYHDTRHTYGEQ